MVVAQEKIQWQEEIQESNKSEKRRKVNRPRKKAQRRIHASIVLLILITSVAGAIGAEAINLTVVKGAQVRNLEKEIKSLEAQNDLLQVQTDRLRSVSRIESKALAMGMEKPAGTVYVSGILPAVKDQTGDSPSQTKKTTTVQTNNEKPSVIREVSQIFTSFFASTQR